MFNKSILEPHKLASCKFSRYKHNYAIAARLSANYRISARMIILKTILVLALTSCVLAAPDIDDLFKVRESGTVPGDTSRPKCGYESCPRVSKDKINVHLVAHTHDDVGWLKTVDQYFYGTRKFDSPAGVQFILDSVIPELIMDKSKRFIYVEMSFFTKWWDDQDEPTRAAVKRLVNEGRLEFVNGGWCMNDEATTSYQSIIEQMTLGLRFLNQTFGACGRPRAGWQIDPFGHSNEQASLFAQFGFDAMYFTRINYDDKRSRTENKSLDIIWHGDQILAGESGAIFTNIFRDGYDSPINFCFDALCKDDYLVDNKRSYEYNMDTKGKKFIDFIKEYASKKITNHVLIPMGGDFQYTAAGQNFRAIDKLIKYVRASAPEIEIFYSTPSCYQFAVFNAIDENSIRLPDKYDDFMPYASSISEWWSGYFSSRPSVKLVERQVANLLPVTRMASLNHLIYADNPGGASWVEKLAEHESKCLTPLWEILGDLQHHDAITGTEKQHVTNDYIRRSTDARVACTEFLGDLHKASILNFAKTQPSQIPKHHILENQVYLGATEPCPLLNISQCCVFEPVSDNESNRNRGCGHANLTTQSQKTPLSKSVLINVYNPLARQVNHDIRLPCNYRCDLSKIKVIHAATNETMKLTRLPNPAGVSSLPFRDAVSYYEVVFHKDIPALGYTAFIVEDRNKDEGISISDKREFTPIIDTSEFFARGKRSTSSRYEYFEMNGGTLRHKRDQDSRDDRLVIKFDMRTGMIVHLKRVRDGNLMKITQKFGWYFPANAGASPGAYIFRPNTTEPDLLEKPLSYSMFKRKNGALIEVHQKWADWIWQTIRVDANKNYIEFDYVVGPIPTTLHTGREVISRYETSLKNKGVFFTDSNSRQLLPRHKRRSPADSLGSSFYPVVSTILVQDLDNRSFASVGDSVAILTDRPQAGTSLNEGQLELLIHRRQMRDDGFGVEEPLDEPGEDERGLVTRGKHRVYLQFGERPPVELEKSSHVNKLRLFRLPLAPESDINYERERAQNRALRNLGEVEPIVAHDRIHDELRQESVKSTLQPVLTFNRLRVSAHEFIDMIATGGFRNLMSFSMLNATLPSNVHILTLQPWSSKDRSILIRLENLDNPLTLYPFFDIDSYNNIRSHYESISELQESRSTRDGCSGRRRPNVVVDIEYLIKQIRIVAIEEFKLGADVKVEDEERLKWTEEFEVADGCRLVTKPTAIQLAPRQIRTFLVEFERL